MPNVFWLLANSKVSCFCIDNLSYFDSLPSRAPPSWPSFTFIPSFFFSQNPNPPYFSSFLCFRWTRAFWFRVTFEGFVAKLSVATAFSISLKMRLIFWRHKMRNLNLKEHSPDFITIWLSWRGTVDPSYMCLWWVSEIHFFVFSTGICCAEPKFC